jgi:hypothetical protein
MFQKLWLSPLYLSASNKSQSHVSIWWEYFVRNARKGGPASPLGRHSWVVPLNSSLHSPLPSMFIPFILNIPSLGCRTPRNIHSVPMRTVCAKEMKGISYCSYSEVFYFFPFSRGKYYVEPPPPPSILIRNSCLVCWWYWFLRLHISCCYYPLWFCGLWRHITLKVILSFSEEHITSFFRVKPWRWKRDSRCPASPISTIKSYISLLKTPNKYTFTLKMATEMFTETLDNSQHSTMFIPESRSYTLNSSRENLMAGILSVSLQRCRNNINLVKSGEAKGG